jgi:hypothetical protein
MQKTGSFTVAYPHNCRFPVLENLGRHPLVMRQQDRCSKMSMPITSEYSNSHEWQRWIASMCPIDCSLLLHRFLRRIPGRRETLRLRIDWILTQKCTSRRQTRRNKRFSFINLVNCTGRVNLGIFESFSCSVGTLFRLRAATRLVPSLGPLHGIRFRSVFDSSVCCFLGCQAVVRSFVCLQTGSLGGPLIAYLEVAPLTGFV